MATIKYKKQIGFCVLLGAVLTLLSLIIVQWINNHSLSAKLLNYTKQNGGFTFCDIVNYDWDIAYLDDIGYSRGEILREKYELQYDFQMLGEHNIRIVFCKDGQVLKEHILPPDFYLYDGENDIVYPDDIWILEQKGDDIFRLIRVESES